MSGKICCIVNLAPHYNAAIFKLMDKEIECDFYIGDRIQYPIELMRYDSLKGYKKSLRFRPIVANFYWQQGAISLAVRPYKHYIITGDPFCLSSWFIALLNRLTGRKTYFWTHGWYGKESNLKKSIKKLFFGLSNKVLLYGDYARNLMIKEGFDPKKLISIYNSLDYESQLKTRQILKETLVYEQHFQNQYPVLLYIGRIQRRKKIELLIEALNELVKTKSYYNLILIGDQVDNTEIYNLVTSYGLKEYVWFFGPCYDESILSELIYNAEICVSPGNVGLTAIHTLTYGTPVITQNNFTQQMPEFEAIVPYETGDFFAGGSVENLCYKIKSWSAFSKNNRDTIRQKCYNIIDEKYNPLVQINILKNIFNQNSSNF